MTTEINTNDRASDNNSSTASEETSLPYLRNRITLSGLTKKYDPISIPSQEMMMQQMVMENCAVKTVMSGAMGGLFGAAFGIFSASLEGSGGSLEPMAVDTSDKPTRVIIKEQLILMRNKAWSYAKGFALMGAVYSCAECLVEKQRGKHDWKNATYAGCATGAFLAFNGGAQAMCAGCVGMAAFSTAIEFFLQGH